MSAVIAAVRMRCAMMGTTLPLVDALGKRSLSGRQAREVGRDVGDLVGTQGELLGMLDRAVDHALDRGFQISCRFSEEHMHFFAMASVAGSLVGFLPCRRISRVRGNPV